MEGNITELVTVIRVVSIAFALIAIAVSAYSLMKACKLRSEIEDAMLGSRMSECYVRGSIDTLESLLSPRDLGHSDEDCDERSDDEGGCANCPDGRLCGDEKADDYPDNRRDGGGKPLAEAVEGDLADEVVTFWKHGEGPGRFYVSVPLGLKLYSVSVCERGGLWGKLERFLGKGYKVEAVQLAEHVDLSRDRLEAGAPVYALESLPEVIGFVPVPPYAEEEKRQVCGRPLHTQILSNENQ